MPTVKPLIRRLLGPKLIGLYHLSHLTALDEWGWYASIEKRFPCDKRGQPLPWMSYAAVALLAAKASADWDVFEFGAGYSTLWWGKRCQTVVSCEHNVAWSQLLLPQLPANCSLISLPLDEEYPHAARRTRRRYDVVVVDGRKRVRCALAAKDCLTERGVMVWDDTERAYYQDGLARLVAEGFRRIDLVGMSPLTMAPKQTSILYREGNLLGL